MTQLVCMHVFMLLDLSLSVFIHFNHVYVLERTINKSCSYFKFVLFKISAIMVT